MNILIVNPIMYSCENKRTVPKVKSVKDTLLCNLCNEFSKQRYQVTLYTNNIYKPLYNEEYPYKVIWDEPIHKSIFLAACFPYLKSFREFLINNKNNYDFIISSEVFQWTSLICAIYAKDKSLIWHETARHNRILKTIPSRFWYNFIARTIFSNVLVVPRSREAYTFVSKYCKKVASEPIEHGIDGDKFVATETKEDYFIVVSQLIERKHVDQIMIKFDKFLSDCNREEATYRLRIYGEGDQLDTLIALKESLQNGDYIDFVGKVNHEELIPALSGAKSLLINSSKENSMVSIIEAIAVGTPIITTTAPLNCSYIIDNELGIVSNEWGEQDLATILRHNNKYVKNCIRYRDNVLNTYKVKEFIDAYKAYLEK